MADFAFPPRRGRPPKPPPNFKPLDPAFVEEYNRLNDEARPKNTAFLNDDTWAAPIGTEPPPAPMPKGRVRNEAGQYLFDLSLQLRGVAWADFDGGVWDRWIIARFKEKWPLLSEPVIRGHMRTWCGARDHRFVRCENSVGLAIVRRDVVGGNSTVYEVFMFMGERNRDEKSAIRICREWQIWAASLRVERVEIGDLSDMVNLADTLGAKEERRFWLEPRRQ